jgi:hypothetical protein
MFSERGIGHSEKLLDTWLQDNEIAAEQVTRWYTEREPCNLPEHLCRDLLATNYPNVPVTWSIPFTTQAQMSAAREYMGEDDFL